MDKRIRRPAAFKHGGYCRTNVLPGEDAAAFKKLHEDLVAEFRPQGPVEENIVADLAQLYWRKQNMATYRLAALARRRRSAFFNEMFNLEVAIHSQSGRILREMHQMSDEQARKELGDAGHLLEMGEIVTVDYLLKEVASPSGWMD